VSGTCICPAGYYGSECRYHHTCMVLSYLCYPCCSFHHKHIETYCYGQTISHSFLFILYCLLHRVDWHLFIVLVDYIYISSFHSSVHLPFSSVQATPLVKMAAHVVVIIPAHALQVTTETTASTAHILLAIHPVKMAALAAVTAGVIALWGILVATVSTRTPVHLLQALQASLLVLWLVASSSSAAASAWCFFVSG
jgi:hypothetical protein